MRADFLNLRSQIASFETSLATGSSESRVEEDPVNHRATRSRAWSTHGGLAPPAVAFASLLIVAAIIGLLIYIEFQHAGTNTCDAQSSVSSTRPQRLTVRSNRNQKHRLNRLKKRSEQR